MEENNQNRSQNGFVHTNFNKLLPKDNGQHEQVKIGVIARKKAQAARFVAKTKARWEQVKKTSRKVLYFSMVFYVIVSAIITYVVLTNPMNHWYAYQNPEKLEILRNADPEEMKGVFDSYKRVDERNIKERKEDFGETYDPISMTEPREITIANDWELVPTAHAASKTTVRIVTAYNLVPEQTDNTPCVGAANQNLCYLMREKGMNVCAANRYKFGTILKIPGYLGSQKDGNDTCVVLDVLHEDYAERVDISMDQNITRAKKFGTQTINVTVVGYMESWDKLAPAEKFKEPNR